MPLLHRQNYWLTSFSTPARLQFKEYCTLSLPTLRLKLWQTLQQHHLRLHLVDVSDKVDQIFFHEPNQCASQRGVTTRNSDSSTSTTRKQMPHLTQLTNLFRTRTGFAVQELPTCIRGTKTNLADFNPLVCRGLQATALRATYLKDYRMPPNEASFTLDQRLLPL